MHQLNPNRYQKHRELYPEKYGDDGKMHAAVLSSIADKELVGGGEEVLTTLI